MNKKIFTVPNLLSVIRLCLIPLIVLTYVRGQFIAAAALLAASGLTDTLDGTIARRFNQISSLGKILDPLADKLTMAAVALALVWRHPPLWPALAVLVLKEGAMLIGALILFQKGTRPAESKLMGKLATVVLYAVFFAVMVTDLAGAALPDWSLWTLSAVCGGMMIAALCQYIPIFIGIQNGTYNVETEQFEGETK